MRFSEEELRIAKSVDLCDVASSMGYTVKRIGRYHTLKEMDSIRIYDRSHWFRWSRQFDKGENGGSQIDFLRVFGGMDVKDAVFWLLDFAGYHKEDIKESKHLITHRKDKVERKQFLLPEPNQNNQILFDYLTQKRGISPEVVNYFVEKKLIYETKQYHNVAFLGRDMGGVIRFASLRGTKDYHGSPFKCDVAGNDKQYGFNDRNSKSTEVFVFEGAIDLISYVEICEDYDSNKIALGMLADAPLETFLQESPQVIKIIFCLDNDGPGKIATQSLIQKYKDAGYEVGHLLFPSYYKDVNEWLVEEKRNVQEQEQSLSR